MSRAGVPRLCADGHLPGFRSAFLRFRPRRSTVAGPTLRWLFLGISLLCACRAGAAADTGVPVLLYHRFGPVVVDSMTVTTAVAESQLQAIHDRGDVVIALRTLVDWKLGRGPEPPANAVVIVADDGHRSVYTDLFPLLRRWRMPVTLFIYPSAISNASYAMTWEQVREMVDSGLADVQSHTYWHPNFKRDRARMSAVEFDRSMQLQLVRARAVLEKRIGRTVDCLAWPFGIFDDDLMRRAAAAGYVAAFTLERRPVRRADPMLALPRFLVTDRDRGAAFVRLLDSGRGGK
ncbi:MAG: polysaccharide deacetylase family protein [Gammaproteobacteria bacterium]